MIKALLQDKSEIMSSPGIETPQTDRFRISLDHPHSDFQVLSELMKLQQAFAVSPRRKELTDRQSLKNRSVVWRRRIRTRSHDGWWKVVALT
jgi:hypothetical protein